MIEDQHRLKEMPKEEYCTPHLCFSVGKRETPLKKKQSIEK